MAVEIIQSIGPKELGPQKNVEADKAHRQTTGQKSSVSSAGDQAVISERAQALKEELETLKTRAQTISEETQSRIETARQRIQTGFYLRDDVLTQVAGKILDSEPSLVPAQSGDEKSTGVAGNKDLPDSQTARIARAKSRVAEGFYQQNSVLNITAENIVKNLLV